MAKQLISKLTCKIKCITLNFNDTNSKPELTVRTSIGLQPESNPSTGIPVQRDKADIPSNHWMLELMLNHAVCVSVSWKGLGNTKSPSLLVFKISNYYFWIRIVFKLREFLCNPQ